MCAVPKGGEGEVFDILRPAGSAVPLVLDSPHSGTLYPPDFRPAQPPERYRRAEDMYVDELFSSAPTLSLQLLTARFGRIYCDVNRAFDDLDPASLDDAEGLELAPSAKARLGKGVVWTATPPDGAPLLAGPVRRAEYLGRLERCWRPYHAALGELLESARAVHGRVFHLDLHSMQPVANAMHEDATGSLRPDIVLSDREGTSAGAGYLEAARALLIELGFSVTVNDPFKGAEILRRHGNPARGVHSLQIEVNRALYMDVETYGKTARFRDTRARFSAFLASLRDWAAKSGS
ncbi:N-formylglutamate amidohydrolase [Stappia sp. 28M-7]|uniref:N-formylglutamate amidohydrolase n=1 Tax=Stappia sp. 28M-7 TaxID=2762596 RepID=UPI00163C8340|nr:N-formylglutamate amidohydrolase [Stappia sp. 28M-7]MBC2858926.1 N-formylglutamate amidohydrolase [Stappia sp. 28M-7]